MNSPMALRERSLALSRKAYRLSARMGLCACVGAFFFLLFLESLNLISLMRWGFFFHKERLAEESRACVGGCIRVEYA